MNDDTPDESGKRIDDTPFRQELFRQTDGNASGQPEAKAGHEHGNRVAPDSDPGPAERPSVGYRKPPAGSRFAKGQSGNPKGRPKGSGKAKVAPPIPPSSVEEIRRRLAATPVRVREGDATREIHLVEALSKNLDKLAFAGGVQATRAALDRHEDTLRRLDAEYQDNMAWMADYCARFPEHVAACEKAGETVPDHIPRPEDIHCSREEGLHIVGPYDLRSLENYVLIKRWRDALHVKMIYDEIVFFDRPGVRVTLTMAEFFVHHMDRLMPKRWKLASKEMQDREWELIWIARPKLIEKLEATFEPLGLKAPIKKPMPPMHDRLLRALKLNPRQLKDRFAKMEAG